MLTKKVDPFISLKIPEPEGGMYPEPAVGSLEVKREPRYPDLYVEGVPLPISDKDLEEDIIATVKLKVKRVSSQMKNGKLSTEYRFEVKGIKLET